MSGWVDEWSNRQRKDRPWEEYPTGTKAWAIGGGYWIRVERGWKWFNGSTFPTPGADAFDVTIPSVNQSSTTDESNPS